MAQCSNHFPDVLDELNAAEYDAWSLQVRRAGEHADLLEWARQSLPSAALPCTCIDDVPCLRCRVDRLVAVADAEDQRRKDVRNWSNGDGAF